MGLSKRGCGRPVVAAWVVAVAALGLLAAAGGCNTLLDIDHIEYGDPTPGGGATGGQGQAGAPGGATQGGSAPGGGGTGGTAGTGGTGTGAGGGTGGAVGQPPVGNDDGASTNEDSPTAIDVLSNDEDPDPGDVLSVAGVDNTGTVGQVSVEANDTITYDPDGQFESLDTGDSQQDSFVYTVSDGNGGSDTATVVVTVTGVNDPPVADPKSENAAGPTVIVLTGSDVEGDPLTFAIDSPPSHGSLGAVTPVSATSAQVVYTPNGGYAGPDSFTYVANDGDIDSPAATVSITVEATPLVLSGNHTFDTDTGQLDGTPHPDWDGTTLHVSGVNIQAGAVLTITGSQPFVVDASGDVVIAGDIVAAGGAGGPGGIGCNNINGGAGGLAGPGGYDGGGGGGYAPGSGDEYGDAGQGPGGGGGANVYNSGGGGGGHLNPGSAGSSGAGGSAYASLPPLVGGSGGGGGSVEDDGSFAGDDDAAGGGGGGGVVSITAGGSLTVTGTIDASGGAGGVGDCGGGDGGGGSGGAIYLEAASTPNTSGGTLSVAGGQGGIANGGDGSAGRVVITP